MASTTTTAPHSARVVALHAAARCPVGRETGSGVRERRLQ